MRRRSFRSTEPFGVDHEPPRPATTGDRPLVVLAEVFLNADSDRGNDRKGIPQKCYVGSLRDGMNLVATEFVSARNDERGALMLSELTGAARQLPAALLIDPTTLPAQRAHFTVR
jgi:hypothetical protein